MTEAWGTLRPDDIPSARRLQSLGLTSSIHYFNERSVPSIGGFWFAMPLIWSMLGIAVARKLEFRPIEVANAVEALAMRLALDHVGPPWRPTPWRRCRDTGSRKCPDRPRGRGLDQEARSRGARLPPKGKDVREATAARQEAGSIEDEGRCTNLGPFDAAIMGYLNGRPQGQINRVRLVARHSLQERANHCRLPLTTRCHWLPQ